MKGIDTYHNMKDLIRLILREETVDGKQSNKLTSRRLLYMVDEYLEDNLNPKYVCRHWSKDEASLYVNETIGEITRFITDEIFNIRNYGLDYSEEWGKIYDVTYNLLIELNYDGKVREFFYDAISNCE